MCAIILFSCKNTDDKLRIYIEQKCGFTNGYSCSINIKEALNVDYDTMFIFNEYSEEGMIGRMLGIKYSSTNLLMPNNLLVQDSHYKMILLKNKQIVYENDFEPQYIDFSGGIKLGVVYNKKFIAYCTIYKSPIFFVKKIDNSEESNRKYFYLLKN